MNKCSVLFLLLALGVQVITASVIPTEILQNNNGGVQGRSYGGSKAAAGHFLYQASLRDDEDRHFCGGCIIRLLWVLTAGRCTRPYLQNIINVVVGSHLLSSGGATHISDLILIHPDFSSVTYASDISLIKVDKPFGIGTFVKIIPLDFSITAEEESVTTSGWGEESFPGGQPDHLKFLDTKTISDQKCRDRLRPIFNSSLDKTICTESPRGKGNCWGDYGNPLVRNGSVVGIASRFIPCAMGFPDVYTRVSSYEKWITESLKK